MALPRKILVPTDFSEDAAVALDYALELAAKLGAAVHVVHFYALPLAPFGAPFGSSYAFPTGDMLKGIEDESAKALASLIQKHARPGVEITSSARLGDARSGIQEAAVERAADLVCMGTHGRRGLSHVLLGSVAEYTVRVSSIPTLTVRARPSA